MAAVRHSRLSGRFLLPASERTAPLRGFLVPPIERKKSVDESSRRLNRYMATPSNADKRGAGETFPIEPNMPKRLLTLALLLAQLLSWSAPPVYLCLECDGSVGIDAGPEHCDCHAQDAASEHRFAADHDHERHSLDADCGTHDEDCGCRHIQISQQQSPAVVSSSASFDTRQAADACAAAVCCASSLAADVAAAFCLLRLSSVDPSPPAAQFSLVRRC
jgi:hypothetical protein